MTEPSFKGFKSYGLRIKAKSQPCISYEVGFGLSRGPFSTYASYFMCA